MITLLSKETIDKIAAGEVVERPLSVVKELTENSIDAGATVISIETKDGGTGLIRITDNGCGISPTECEKAFLRHSTSKIKTSTDLLNLSTLGFRGEALSSIAAVSKIELITKCKDETLGTSLILSGGNIIENKDTAAPNGTTFFIRDLFYNTPARKKFLKSKATENSAIEEVIEHLALSSPHISFKLTCEGKERIYTSGSGNLKNTIFEIFGKNTAASIIPVKEETDLFSISGFIGNNGLTKGTRAGETFFVNNRFIKSNTLSAGLEDGFRGQLMGHQFPFCVLNLSFPNGSVDVNVHPTKQEVRFNDPLGVQDILANIIKNTLRDREDIESITLTENETPAVSAIQNEKKPDINYNAFSDENNSNNKDISIEKEITYLQSVEKTLAPFEEKKREEVKKEIEDIKKDLKDEAKKATNEDDIIGEQISFNFISEEARTYHRVIGQAFGTYWLVEYNDNLYMIDQHAAHEKVLYERLIKSIENAESTSQLIAPPIVVSLSAAEENILNKNMDSFTKAGYGIEHFGGKDYKISAIPAHLPGNDPKMLLLETLSDGFSVSAERIVERVASMSCKAAVKGNNDLSRPEIEALIDELLTLDDPYHCPHGRPTMISFSKYELDKKFRRIV